MNTQTVSKVTVQLFVGCHSTSEVKMHLNHSGAWKQASIGRSKNDNELVEVYFQGKEYLGYYLPTEKVTLEELNLIEHLVKEKLQVYCPDLDTKNSKLSVFAQVFVT